MGFGHRVYKNYDPRATVMQKTCHEVLNEVGHGDDPLLKVALELEKIALNDPYFVDRKLYPNVDFYSGITLRALGFPAEMFTVLFSLAPHGWLDQPMEEMFGSPQRRSALRQLCRGELRTRSCGGRARLVRNSKRRVLRHAPSRRYSSMTWYFDFQQISSC